jgi:hypothetical protein
MVYKLKNNSNQNMSVVEQLFEKYYPYAQKVLQFDKPVTVQLESDLQNSKNPLGRTAHYDPDNGTITVFVDGRHPKDIMRSLSHELTHHAQNCAGHFDNSGPTDEGYAQTDPHLRKMEEDAYLRGNLCFRDWENSVDLNLQEKKQMTTNDKALRNIIIEAIKQTVGELEEYRKGSPSKTKPEKYGGDPDKKAGLKGIKDFDPVFENEEDLEETTAGNPLKTGGIGGKEDIGDKAFGSHTGTDSKTHHGRKNYEGHLTKALKHVLQPAEWQDVLDKVIEKGMSGDIASLTSGIIGQALATIKAGIDSKSNIAEESCGDEDLEEGGAAARKGNEDKDVGRNRMHPDRVHENKAVSEAGVIQADQTDAEKEQQRIETPDVDAFAGPEGEVEDDTAGEPIPAGGAAGEEVLATPEKERTQKEGQDTNLKEWYEGSLYGKLLTEWTKKGV